VNEKSLETLSVVVEREIVHPPEKIWRALTHPHLIEEWLMKNDFKAVVGPHVLLLLTGLFLFVLPSAAKWRSGRRTGAPA
jgi:hypothetical protein